MKDLLSWSLCIVLLFDLVLEAAGLGQGQKCVLRHCFLNHPTACCPEKLVTFRFLNSLTVAH